MNFKIATGIAGVLFTAAAIAVSFTNYRDEAVVLVIIGCMFTTISTLSRG